MTEPQSSALIPAGADFRTVLVASDFLKVEIDQASMYVGPLPITNSSEDREGDRVDPNGLLLTGYLRSPVVYWQHSHQIEPLIPPIGTAETPDRKFNVYRQGDMWYAGTLFSKSLPLANQIFHLIVEGIVRSRSLGAIALDIEPITPGLPTVTLHEGEVVVTNPVASYFRSAEMIEFSWCGIACNRDITIELKSLLSRKRVAGERMDPFLFKTLKKMDLREPVMVAGWTKKRSREANMSGQLVGILFDKTVTPGKASEFLKAAAGTLRDTELTVCKTTGLLKSVQVQHDGPVVTKAVKDAPLVRFLYAADISGSAFPADGAVLKANNTQQLQAEADAVEQAKQGQAAGQAPPQQPGQQKPAPQGQAAAPPQGQQGAPAQPPAGQQAPPEKNATMPGGDILTQAIAVEDEPAALTGPAGSQHLQALCRSLTKMIGDADASIGDVEQPDVRASHEKFAQLSKGVLKELQQLHDTVYSGNDQVTVKMCPECAEEAAEQAAAPAQPADESAVKTKALIRREAFRGHRTVVTKTFFGNVLNALNKVPAVVAGQNDVNAEETKRRESLKAELKALDEMEKGVYKPGSFAGLMANVGSVGLR